MTSVKALPQTQRDWRADFPGLAATMHGKRLAFLDSAASAQKPQVVIDTMREIMETGYANVHRGLYEISQNLTEDYEAVRLKIAKFIGAPSWKNIVFTRNATEAVNLVAQSWGRSHLKAGDEIILSDMEHHANIVPWQMLREQIGVVLKIVPLDDRGVLDLAAYEAMLSTHTRLVSVVHISNALGTVNPVKQIIETAKKYNPQIVCMLDGSQAVVHSPIHMESLGADFYVFTGHKLYGPTGVGVLYGRSELLNAMPPYQGGGDMIEQVSWGQTTYKEPPHRFEAGTPPIVEVIGLGKAVDYLVDIGMDQIAAHEAALLREMTAALEEFKGLRILGTAPEKAGIVSFTMEGAHPSDIGMVLDQMGVAVRTGYHCCMPLMQRYGLDGTVRVSLGLYSNKDDIVQLCEGLKKVKELFA